jgi:hypothetical protein
MEILCAVNILQERILCAARSVHEINTSTGWLTPNVRAAFLYPASKVFDCLSNLHAMHAYHVSQYLRQQRFLDIGRSSVVSRLSLALGRQETVECEVRSCEYPEVCSTQP